MQCSPTKHLSHRYKKAGIYCGKQDVELRLYIPDYSNSGLNICRLAVFKSQYRNTNQGVSPDLLQTDSLGGEEA